MKIHLKNLIVTKTRGRQDFAQIEALSESLKANGQIQSIAVTPNPEKEGTYILLAGERRYRAALLAGMGELEAIVYPNIPESTQRTIELEENVQRRDLSWQEQDRIRLAKYRALQEESKGTEGLKVLAGKEGISVGVLSESVTFAKKLEARPDILERVKHLPKHAAMKMAERIEESEKYIDMEKRGVITASTDLKNLDALTGIRGLPDNSIDLLLTDPPYGVENIEALQETGSSKMVQYGMMSKEHNLSLPEITALLKSLAPEFFRVLKPGSHFYMFTGFQHAGDFINALHPYLEFQPPLLVWDRSKPSAPGFGYNYLSRLEAIIYGYKPPRTKRLAENKYNLLSHPEVPRSIRIYPTEKPVSLLRELIEQSTITNDLVLDPFAGSASSLVAAKRCGRRAIGFEIDKESWARSQNRLKEELTQGAVK